jgi:two-component system, LytTR family, sensor kinase
VRKKHYTIIIHLVFWFYWLNQLLYPFYINSSSFEEKNSWIGTIVVLGLSIVNFYAVYFSLPYLMKLKHKIISISAGACLILLLAVFRYYFESTFWRDLLGSEYVAKMAMKEWFFNNLRLSFITSIYALLIKFAIDWFHAQKLKAEMESQNRASELALLRSQINPHFLFNTLNNIYSLVYKKSDEAPAAVMKLSSIMRYMLYDANTEKVPLEKEIEYLQSFIELQKLRQKEQDFVEMTITGSPEGKTIAPMLLIPFVENAFKHGNKSGSCPGISITLTIKPGSITFEVNNSVRSDTTIQKDASAGIGLHNIQRRLDLLYPGKHSLLITEENALFNVKLILEN